MISKSALTKELNVQGETPLKCEKISSKKVKFNKKRFHLYTTPTQVFARPRLFKISERWKSFKISERWKGFKISVRWKSFKISERWKGFKISERWKGFKKSEPWKGFKKYKKQTLAQTWLFAKAIRFISNFQSLSIFPNIKKYIFIFY